MKSTLTLNILLTSLFLFALYPMIAQVYKNGPVTLTPMEELGKELFFDKIADPDNMSCADCHASSVGFTGPVPGINKKGSVYPGAVPQRFGNRKPPSAAYATFSPVFKFDDVEGLFIGGNFWDGRATGEVLGNPAADQALGPFLNPVEQNNASKQAVLEQIASSKYADLWEVVWGEPIGWSNQSEIDANYDRVGLAIAEYEASAEVNSFSSKFDYFLQGLVELTPEEEWGMELFNDESKGKCSLCHISEVGPDGEPPLFTDFTFDNLGVPKNPDNPFYDMDEVYLPDGSAINPLGEAWIDYGLGTFLENHPDPVWQALAGENMGKHKVPTLRNVGLQNGNGNNKAFMHNGVFKSLKEVVHFYNTRDVESWPPPEVPMNVNDAELGDLGLTDEEEDAIVAFMETLSDGYKLPKSSAPIEPEIYANMSFEHNGLNPFSHQTQVSYYLPENLNVQMDVYSISGQKVTSLVEGIQTAGEHLVTINGSNWEPGIYIICLRSGNKTLTKKISLTK
jgi:cytochrome c peroxidase